MNLADEWESRSTGCTDYTIHFEKGAAPPVRAFWSITLYDSAGFQVANPLNRFAVSSWMPFKYNADGSLDLYFQSDSPGKGKEANWLPAPKAPVQFDDAALCAGRRGALTGKWNPPPVKEINASVSKGAEWRGDGASRQSLPLVLKQVAEHKEKKR